jgi:deazaflavin-dependent oxidoreductase (nitroreductase family)
MATLRTTTTTTTTAHPGPRKLAQAINPLVLRLAGTRLLPLYGVIQHRGRRSGKLFHTPVVVRPTRDGFVVPLPWGEGTDWCRNVRAAGGCIVRWKGRDYPLAQPEVVDAAEARAAFPAVQWAAMRRLGIGQCLRLRFATSSR